MNRAERRRLAAIERSGYEPPIEMNMSPTQKAQLITMRHRRSGERVIQTRSAMRNDGVTVGKGGTA